MSAPRLCGKQTMRGAKAKANLSRFAPCVLDAGHLEDCDSGTPTTPTPPKAA